MSIEEVVLHPQTSAMEAEVLADIHSLRISPATRPLLESTSYRSNSTPDGGTATHRKLDTVENGISDASSFIPHRKLEATESGVSSDGSYLTLRISEPNKQPPPDEDTPPTTQLCKNDWISPDQDTQLVKSHDQSHKSHNPRVISVNNRAWLRNSKSIETDV